MKYTVNQHVFMLGFERAAGNSNGTIPKARANDQVYIQGFNAGVRAHLEAEKKARRLYGKAKPKPLQHNAHCRARNALLRRIVDRRYDWGLGPVGRKQTRSELEQRAARVLARYTWPDGWQWRQTGRYTYTGYTGPKVLYKDVPMSVIHTLACRLFDDRS